MKQLFIGYVIGLIDAEASFSVSIKIQKDLKYGVRLDPVFSITQSNRRALELVAKVIGAGRIIRKPGQRHLYLIVIDNMNDLINKLIPFLDKYQNMLRTKNKQYKIFRDIVFSLHKGIHRDVFLLKELVSKAYILSQISTKSHRKRNLREILEIIDSFVTERQGFSGREVAKCLAG